MSVIRNFDVQRFLTQYWQQAPLLVRGAFPDIKNLISGDDLAALAMEPNVESRLIQYQRDQDRWSVKHGPFQEDVWQTLPNADWTLLVQAVDHWDEDVEKIKSYFDFLPAWRIDDIMVSFATNGGGVGPHFDQYDVFLIQGQGKREWRIGQMCNEASELIEGLSVKVLAEFDDQETWLLEPGDMLYLPPALAHWGIAQENCITFSVGFRAPSKAELISDFGHFLSHHWNDFERYSDATIENRQHASHQILDTDIARVQQILHQAANSEGLIAQWLGHYMTEPKYDDTATDGANYSHEEFQDAWQRFNLHKNPACRMAYHKNTLYIDGSRIEGHLTVPVLEWITSQLQFSVTDPFLSEHPEVGPLLTALLNLGALYFSDES